jgi:hypothetical protein
VNKGLSEKFTSYLASNPHNTKECIQIKQAKKGSLRECEFEKKSTNQGLH